VWSDFQNGAVSFEAARTVYGVCVTERGVEVEETSALRHRLLQERIGKPSMEDGALQDAPAPIALGPSLLLVKTEQGWQVQSRAGYVLATGTTAWRARAVARPARIENDSGHIRLHENLAMTAFYCPSLGMLLAVDVHEKDAHPVDDILLDLESFTGEKNTTNV